MLEEVCRRETGGTGILGVGGRGVCVLTELNQLLTSTGGERVVDLGCRRSLSLGWVVIIYDCDHYQCKD